MSSANYQPREYAGWLIKKGSQGYYRPNWRGYTDKRKRAGRYTLTQANAEMRLDSVFTIEAAPETIEKTYLPSGSQPEPGP